MPTYDQSKLYDGHVELLGVNGHTRPLKLPRNLVHRAINTRFRGDEAKPRPGVKFVPLSFQSDVVQRDVNGGRFQGGAVYTPDDGNSFLTMMKGGRLFKLDIAKNEVADISITGSTLLLAPFLAPAVGSSVTISVHEVANFTVGATCRISGYRYQIVSTSGGSTLLTAPFVVPGIGLTAVATVASTTGFVLGSTVFLDHNRYIVSVIGGPTSITLENVDDANVSHPIGAELTFGYMVITNLDDTPSAMHDYPETVEYFDVNSSQRFRAWSVQAEKWQIWQDGESRALIFDGASSRRATNLEVPAGEAMGYGWGRIWVALPGGKKYVAGDLIYGPSGTLSEQLRDAVLKFTENTYLSEGGAFTVPENAGTIRGMGFLATLDTSLGQGPLQIFTDVGGFTVAANIKRTDWNNYNADATPVVAVSIKERGLESDRTLAPINSDFYYRGEDGIRSFQLSRREFGTWWNTPISNEVDWALFRDPQSLLMYGSGIYFDRRYLCTCGVQASSRGIIHQGLVALDLEQQSWLSQESPQWDGLWTFAYIYQIVSGKFNGVERAFAFCENGEGDFELYEITRDDHEDQADTTQPTKIRWAMEFGSLTFPRGEGVAGIFDLKQLHGGELFCSDVEDEVTFKLRFRPDGYPCWVVWHWWKKCATMGDCDNGLFYCPDWQMGQPQMLGPMGIPKPPEVCDSNERRLDIGYAFQTRLDIRGYCTFKAVRYAATQVPQPATVKPEPPITDG